MFNLTPISHNRKTGPIAVSMTDESTCPKACPFRHDNAGGCYAKAGLTNIHWSKLNAGKIGVQFDMFIAKVKKLPIGQLFRHNVSGDLMGKDNRINFEQVKKLVKACKRIKGFTYTHKPMTKANQKAVKYANENGFTINLSGNNPKHADKLADLGIAPVVTVLPSDQTRNSETPKGRKIVVCPATKSDRMTCANCQLCYKKDRSFIVGFPSHGNSKKKVDKIVENY
jgi:hypothetical protein